MRYRRGARVSNARLDRQQQHAVRGVPREREELRAHQEELHLVQRLRGRPPGVWRSRSVHSGGVQATPWPQCIIVL